MTALATITGTMLTPGVSRNKRLYTKELIKSAVERMRDRINDPDALPIVMRTHHGAGDNTRAIVGRVTAVDVDESGTARYTATLYDTVAGRDLLAQISGKDPAFRNTSIYGYWDGQVRQVEHDGQTVETGDGLDIEAIDFTAFPGVPTARIDSVRTGTPQESTLGRHVVTESLEPPVVEAEMTTKAINDLPDSAFAYIEPGGKKDAEGKTVPRSKRHFPIHDAAHVRNALARAPQSPFGSKAMPKILAAAKKFGIKVADDKNKKESTVPDTPLLEQVGETTLSEVTEFFGDDGGAGFCIDAHNGPLCITLRAPCIDPSGLRAVATAAMNAALNALQAMDPDMDADIDIPGAPGADTDGDGDGDLGERTDDDQMETVTPEQQPAETESTLPPVNITPKQLAERLARRKAAATPAAPAPVKPAQLATPVADKTTETKTTPAEPSAEETKKKKESAVSETENTTPAAETATPDAAQAAAPATEAVQAPPVTLTGDDIKSIVAAAVEAALKHQNQTPVPAAQPAPEAPTTETTSPDPAAETATDNTAETSIAESTLKATVNEAVQAATAKAVRDAIPTILDAYGLPRRKGFRTTEEADQEMTRDEMWKKRADIFLGDYGKPA